MATVWSQPSHCPKEADLHMSRSNSFARVTESGQRSSRTSRHGVDRTSTDRLRGLYITSSKGYECGSMFSSEQSVGLDTRSGDVVELTNARSCHSSRGSPISQRSDLTTTQARTEVSDPSISSAATADQPIAHQAGLGLKCDRACLENLSLVATSPPGFNRLNNSMETRCESTPSGAPFIDVNIED